MIDPALRVQTGNDLDLLAEALFRHLAARPLAPHEEELLLVPDRGMARWLTRRLADLTGVAAGVRFETPQAFFDRLAVLCRAGSEDEPRLAAPVAWRLFEALGSEDARVLWSLEDDADGTVRDALARELARQWQEAARHRPDVLRRLEAGQTVEATDRPEHPLIGRLFAEVRAANPQEVFPGERIASLDGADGGDLTGIEEHLPPRLHAFGLASLSPLDLARLQQFARTIEVGLWFGLPSPLYLGDRPDAEGATRALFGSAQRETRDLFGLLAGQDERGDLFQDVAFVEPASEDLLGVTRRAMFQLDDAPESHAWNVTDASVRLIEADDARGETAGVVDALTVAFEELEDLRPEEVAVLHPDPDRIRPRLLAATDALGRGVLPFRFAGSADEDARRLAHWLVLVTRMASGRCTRSEVLDLLEPEPVARAFGLDGCDRARLSGWLEAGAFRWGLDGEHRRAIQQDLPERHTLREASDRLLLGTLTGPVDARMHGLLPARVADSDLLPAAGIARLTDELQTHLPGLRGPHELGVWCERLALVVARWWQVDSETESLARDDVLRGLAELGAITGVGAVSARVLRRHLEALAGPSPVEAGFLDGGVSVLPLGATRMLPFRVVAVMGLSESAFPRRASRPAWDLLAPRVRPGDPDASVSDRGAFHELLARTSDRIVLSATLIDPESGGQVAWSPVVAELMEEWQRWVVGADGQSCVAGLLDRRDALPWNPGLFGTDGPVRGHDPRGPVVADAVQGPARSVVPFWPEGLKAGGARQAAPGEDTLAWTMHAFRSFWKDPARAFLQRVLGVSLPRDLEVENDLEPFDLHTLGRWQLTADMLSARTSGVDPEVRVLRARDGLRWGVAGDLQAAEWEAHWERHEELLEALDAMAMHEVRFEGEHGSVAGRGHLHGHVLLTRLPGQKIPLRTLLPVWVELCLLASASQKAAPRLEAWVLGREESVRLLAPEDPTQCLEVLLEHAGNGLREPLGFHPDDWTGIGDRKEGTDLLRDLSRRWDSGEETALGKSGGAILFRGRKPFHGAEGARLVQVAEDVLLPLQAAKAKMP